MASEHHVWEKMDLIFEIKDYANPYTDLVGWVDLKGPGFEKRCYGFWNGGNEFVVRVTATAPGTWTWQGGSDPHEPGLTGQTGSFEAVEWTEEEKTANECRRGFLRSSPDGHAFVHADGTPCFVLGDTWWSMGTFRFPWKEGDTAETPRSFLNYVALRKSQGYNCIAIIAALPAWVDDGLPAALDDKEGTILRRAWSQVDSDLAKAMPDEKGNTPFQFPGKVPGFERSVPDLDRINPEFFKSLDRKIDHLNKNGIMPFIEVTRRDIGQAWKKYHNWPDSYSRYIAYVWARYQANNCLLSPIHYDTGADSIPAPDWNAAANEMIDRFGKPPFDQPVGTNAHHTTLMNFGHTGQARWLTFHQTGNARRDHYSYSLLTEAFNTTPPVPVLNGEPQYEGMEFRMQRDWYYNETDLAASPSEEGARYVRSAIFGCVLSGGLAGHIYGAGGWDDGALWRADVEGASKVHIWDAILWPGGAQMQHARTFLMSEGERYQGLRPAVQLLDPNRFGPADGFDGWGFCAATATRDLILVYLELGTPETAVTGLVPDTGYKGIWFDPRSGEWGESWSARTDVGGEVTLPKKPTDSDWALKLTRD